MLLSVPLPSKLLSKICSLSLKTRPPPHSFLNTLSFSFHQFCLSKSSFLSLPLCLSVLSPICLFVSSFLNLLLFFLFLSLSSSFFSSIGLSLSLLSSHPLSSFSSPPLCNPCQSSRSWVALSLSWQREWADTWEGCFVIQQVIPPWHRKGGVLMGCREGRRREAWAGLYYYLPTYTFLASLRLRADGLSLFSHRRLEV